MKKILYVVAMLVTTGVYAQNKPVDKVKETKVKTIKVMKDGKMVENKVKVTTEKEQKVMTDPNYKGTIDAPRIFPQTKVTKTVSIDNDNDPFYDTKDELVYFMKNDKVYKFKSDEKGFVMSDTNDNTVGSAIRSTNSSYYLLDINNYSGVGYFTKAGNFVVEYYDADAEMMVVEAFEVNTDF